MSEPVRTRAALRRAGFDDVGIARALRRRELVRVARDRFVEPRTVTAREELLAVPGTRTLLSHAGAARVWGLPASDRALHVVVAHGCRRRGVDFRGVAVHQRRHWAGEVHAGLAVTDPVTTVVDVLRAYDLAEGVVVADAALHGGLVSVEALHRAVAGRRPGDLRVRRAIGFCDARAESPLESRLRLLLTLRGGPPDDVQHVVRENGRFVSRVDLWYDGVVVEADGFEYHRSRADFAADRRKGQAWSRLGLLPLRFTWHDVHGDPDLTWATVRQVRHVVARGVRPDAPRVLAA